jgi:sugar phosphate isomerase/epimerase
MKDFKVALQLYSVREDMKADFEGTLKTVKEMGYDGVEFAGLFRKDAEEIRQLCEKYELIPISAHVPYEDMLKSGTLEAYQQIGCSYVVVPHVSA